MYGEVAVTDQMCQKRFVKFQAGNFLLHIQRPPEVDSDQVKTVIENNEWCTMWEIANILKISRSSIEDNLHQLGYINCFDVWVPRKSVEKKKNFLTIIPHPILY